MKHALIPVLLLAALASPALAEDDAGRSDGASEAPKIFSGEWCLPLDGMMKTVRKVAKLKADKRDTVGLRLSVRLIMDSGEPRPERVELRAGDAVYPVALDSSDRAVVKATELLREPTPEELCIVDPSRAGRSYDAMGWVPSFGMGVTFLNTPGTHDLAQIEDGLRDGRSHYKKMAGAFAMMVPKFTHIAVAGPDEDNPPAVFAVRDGADIGEPAFESFDNARMIAVDTLEEMGADGVRVAGEYRMSPSPDAKTVAKFMK